MPEDRPTQEQSIKDRKKQLYDADAPEVAQGSSRPFKEFLQETPAAPLSGGVKAALWVVGVVVVLLLAAALMKGSGGPKRPGKSAFLAWPTASQRLLASAAYPGIILERGQDAS